MLGFFTIISLIAGYFVGLAGFVSVWAFALALLFLAAAAE